MKLKPLGENILVEVEEEKHSDQIIIPDEVNMKKQGIGKIVAIGTWDWKTGSKKMHPDFKIGDRIVFDYVSGYSKVKDENDKEYIVLPAYSYVLCKIYE